MATCTTVAIGVFVALLVAAVVLYRSVLRPSLEVVFDERRHEEAARRAELASLAKRLR